MRLLFGLSSDRSGPSRGRLSRRLGDWRLTRRDAVFSRGRGRLDLAVASGSTLATVERDAIGLAVVRTLNAALIVVDDHFALPLADVAARIDDAHAQRVHAPVPRTLALGTQRELAAVAQLDVGRVVPVTLVVDWLVDFSPSTLPPFGNHRAKYPRRGTHESVASISPRQVFVTVEKANKQVVINWQASMLLTREQRAEIKDKAQALLPDDLNGFQVIVH